MNMLDDRYFELEKLRGEEGVRVAIDSHTSAIERIDEIVRTEGIDCDFTRLDGYLFLAAQLLELEIAIVEHVHQVAGGHARHAARERPVVEHDHRLPGLAEVIGDAEAGDARADHADIGVHVPLERTALGQLGSRGPDGFMAGHVALQAMT
jgi:hypothetical protein